MSDLLELQAQLKSKSFVKNFLKGVTIVADIEQIQTVFCQALNERKAEVEKEMREAEAKQQAIANMVKQLEEQGVDRKAIAQFFGFNKERVEKKPKAMYEKDGVKWSGKGRVPEPFKDVSKDELTTYLVKTE